MNKTWVWATAFFCAVIAGAGFNPAYAQEPRLDNIIVTNTRDDLLLYLTAKDAFSDKIEKAIHSGVPATFTYYINLYRVRSLYLDEKISELKLAHNLKYDNLKKEYTVTRSWEDYRPLTVKTYEEAQKLMTEVDSLVIVPLVRLEKGTAVPDSCKSRIGQDDPAFLPALCLIFYFFLGFRNGLVHH
jgi:hypothetical protein